MSTSNNVGILGFAHGHVGMYCARWHEGPEVALLQGGGSALKPVDTAPRLQGA